MSIIDEERGRMIAQAYNDAVSVSRLSDDLRQAALLVLADLLEASWPYKPSYSVTVRKWKATANFTPEARAVQAEIPEADQRDQGERIMRVRINTDSMRRELDKLRGSKTPIRGVMIVPKMAASIEEWEAVAEPQQWALLQQARDDDHGVVSDSQSEIG